MNLLKLLDESKTYEAEEVSTVLHKDIGGRWSVVDVFRFGTRWFYKAVISGYTPLQLRDALPCKTTCPRLRTEMCQVTLVQEE